MPALPVVNTLPYDTVDSCVIAARVKVNDAMQTLSGDTLNYQYAFTQITVWNAWRIFKNRLADKGYTRFRSELVIRNLPVAANLDPAVQVCLSWLGYFDGNNQFNVPALPSYFKSPLWLKERISGQLYGFGPEMRNCIDGLPEGWKQPLNCIWEWREDGIYMPGATAVTDMRIRFNVNLVDFQTVGNPVTTDGVTTGGTWWYQQQVPIMDVQQAFAFFIAAEFAAPRADLDANSFLEKGDQEIDQIFNRDVQMKQRVNSRRRPFSTTQNIGGGGNGGWGGGYQNF